MAITILVFVYMLSCAKHPHHRHYNHQEPPQAFTPSWTFGHTTPVNVTTKHFKDPVDLKATQPFIHVIISQNPLPLRNNEIYD